ncbi:MAG TPA: hypothetical protein VN714_16765, partial [Trebonia sp.]|nr:hypothetical protein [Trebonia sp.]
LPTATLVIVFAIIGALVAGTEGTLYFSAAAAWIGTVLSWRQLRQALHETPQVMVPSWLLPRPARAQVSG